MAGEFQFTFHLLLLLTIISLMKYFLKHELKLTRSKIFLIVPQLR